MGFVERKSGSIMALKILACNCGGAEPVARSVLQEAGVENWMTVDIHKGKEHCKTILNYFPEPFHKLLAFQGLLTHIEENSKYAVILGYDDEYLFWEDVASNSPIEVTRAKVIAQRFA